MGEGYKTALSGNKPKGIMARLEGWCGSEVFLSAVSVEVGNGDSCGIKDARSAGELATQVLLRRARQESGLLPIKWWEDL